MAAGVVSRATSFDAGAEVDPSPNWAPLIGAAPWHTGRVPRVLDRDRLVARGRSLEWSTLAWNVVGVAVLSVAALRARSVALAGFGLDSLIEIGASIVVLWELADAAISRQRRALQLIGVAFVTLAFYLAVQSTVILATGFHAHHSRLGIAWTALSALVMFCLAGAKARTGTALANPVLVAEGRVTFIDGVLATVVMAGLVLNARWGWWWADPIAGYALLYYAAHEARSVWRHNRDLPPDALATP